MKGLRDYTPHLDQLKEEAGVDAVKRDRSKTETGGKGLDSLISQVFDIIKSAVSDLDEAERKRVLDRVKFRKDGSMSPNVNMCTTREAPLEELAQLNAKLMKAVEAGASIPQEYLAEDEE